MSIEMSRSVVSTPPGIKSGKPSIPRDLKDSEILDFLSEEHLQMIEDDAIKKVKTKEDKEKKEAYNVGVLQLAGLIPPPKKYYTLLGELIRYPNAYAKTGSPMYGSRKHLIIDLNQKIYIYKLILEEGKIYIGKTNNIKRRINEHFYGKGSKVTQKYKPVNYEILEVCDGYFSDKQEQLHTKENIRLYGYENVRGGKYTNSKTF